MAERLFLLNPDWHDDQGGPWFCPAGAYVEGVLAFKQTWPSMCRTVWGAHKRYMDTYLNVYKGYYFTGDGAARDSEGYYWIRGRVDDVVWGKTRVTLRHPCG